MRKLSLLLGTLGGALAGYILSNDKLRMELSKAKKPEQAAKALSRHLAADGKKIGREVKEFVESDDVQRKLKEAKQFTLEKFEQGKEKMQELVNRGEKQAEKAVRKGGKTAKKAVRNFTTREA